MKVGVKTGFKSKYKNCERMRLNKGAVVRRLTGREIDEWRDRIEGIMKGDKRSYYGTI